MPGEDLFHHLAGGAAVAGARQTLTVEFIKPVENQCNLTLYSEEAVQGAGAESQLNPPQPLGVERESGSLTVSAEDTLVDAARRELVEETGWSAGRVEVLLTGPTSSGMSNERIAFVRARELVRVGEGGGVDDENIIVHAVPRAQAPAWLMRKRAEGFELDLKLWAGLWMIDHNPDGSPAD